VCVHVRVISDDQRTDGCHAACLPARLEWFRTIGFDGAC
jgi:hypothetical protein